MATYRAGVIGCGGIGRNHANGYAEHDAFELVALADIDEAVLADAGEEYPQATTYGGLEGLLEDAAVDFLSICTSHRSHAELTVDAAEHGLLGIVCEKPMATSLGEASTMLTAADRTDTKLVIGHQNRFASAHERARELVSEGAIGEPEEVTVRTTGGLINNGTHYTDYTRFILGDPAPEWCGAHVQRRTDRYERGFPAEDACVGRVCFETGTRLNVETDTPTGLPSDADLVVRGRDGVIQIEYASELRLVQPDGVRELDPSADRSPRLRLLDELLDWTEGDREDHRCSGQRAYTTMEILMGFYEAVRTDRIVEFPIETRANPLAVMIESGELAPSHPGPYDIRHPYASVRRE